MKSTVKKWGNSAAVRIPASVMQASRLDLEDVVDVREKRLASSSNRFGGKLMIWLHC